MHGFALGGDYGLGVIRSELRYGTTPLRVLGHKGGGFGFGSVFSYCPEAQLAWAVFFNRSSGGYAIGESLLDGELANRYGSRRPRVESDQLAPIDLTTPQLHGFVGNYISRNATADITLEGGALVKREGGAISKVGFISPDDAFIVDSDREVVSYRFYPAKAAEPAHLECSVGEDSLDLNRAPDDPPGPDRAEWNRYLGNYVIDQWGTPSLSVTIQRLNGYLTLNGVRLIAEPNRGLFFTADGEAVDFRGGEATWKSLKLRRQS
jgi:hypothetical protein